MIIGLDDEDVQQMLLAKLAGNSPADLIRQRIEDFRLTANAASRGESAAATTTWSPAKNAETCRH